MSKITGTYHVIQLENNKLKRLESSVFKYPLDRMPIMPFPYLNIQGSNIE